jgi:hypothetical protein
MINRISRFGCVLAAGLAMGMVGCEKKETTPATPTNPPAPQPQAVTNAVQNMASSAQSAAKEAAATVTAEAQKLLDQATQYIKENKMDLADTTIKKLEEMKAQLPAEWQAKIADARSMFDKAKAAAAAIPGAVAPAGQAR